MNPHPWYQDEPAADQHRTGQAEGPTRNDALKLSEAQSVYYEDCSNNL